MTVQAISTKSTVVGVMKEVTEGVALDPTSTGAYMPIQDDFAITPSFDTLENVERRASIGVAAPIIAGENPTVTGSFYLKGSGSEGVAPQYSEILESFFGEMVVKATEYDTVASSTTSQIKVNTGEGASFERGQMLLIKDPVNGFGLNAVESVSGDNITPLFNLAVAPGTGVALGKAVLFKPKNDGHPTLTLTEYKGNGGAKAQIAGTRVTNFSGSMAANDNINGTFSGEGVSYYLDPIEITASTRYIDWTDDDDTFAAAVAVKRYKDQYELAEALTSAMNAANPDNAKTVDFNKTTGKFSIVGTGTLLSILWNTGDNAANSIATKLNFSAAADDTGAAATTGYVSDTEASYAAPHTPVFDSTLPVAAKNQRIMIGDATDYVCFDASSVDWSFDNTRTPIESICAESGLLGSIISGRSGTLNVTKLLQKHDSKEFSRFRRGQRVRVIVAWGEKSGGNWVPGKVNMIVLPYCVISAFDLPDNDNLAAMDLELTPAVDENGLGEMYYNS